jgi:hypothetical protein
MSMPVMLAALTPVISRDTSFIRANKVAIDSKRSSRCLANI